MENGEDFFMEHLNLLSKVEYEIYIKNALTDKGILKSYSHKPHLANLPYDLGTNDLDKLRERKQACIEGWSKQQEQIGKKYPKEFYEISDDTGYNYETDELYETGEEYSTQDVEKGIVGNYDINRVVEHYDNLLATHGIVYDDVRERYQDRIDYIKGEIESNKEGINTQKEYINEQKEVIKKARDDIEYLQKIKEQYENEGIAKEDFEAIYDIDFDDVAMGLVQANSRISLANEEIAGANDDIEDFQSKIKDLDARRKQLTQAMPKKTKFPKDSPYYDLLEKRRLAGEFLRDVKVQYDFQQQLGKINTKIAQLEGDDTFRADDQEWLLEGIPGGWLDNMEIW